MKKNSTKTERLQRRQTDTGDAGADQAARFKDAAVEVGVDLDEEKLKATLRGIAKPAKKPGEKD